MEVFIKNIKLNTAVATTFEKLKCKVLILTCETCVVCGVCVDTCIGFVSAFKINGTNM